MPQAWNPPTVTDFQASWLNGAALSGMLPQQAMELLAATTPQEKAPLGARHTCIREYHVELLPDKAQITPPVWQSDALSWSTGFNVLRVAVPAGHGTQAASPGVVLKVLAGHVLQLPPTLYWPAMQVQEVLLLWSPGEGPSVTVPAGQA